MKLSLVIGASMIYESLGFTVGHSRLFQRVSP